MRRISEYCELDRNFPKLPTGELSRQFNSKFFYNLEKKRQDEMILSIKNNQNVILDRCFLSCVAFDYAIGYKINLNWKKTKDEFKNFCNPDLIVYLDLTQDEMKIRRQNDLFKLPSHFTNKTFNDRYKLFFTKIILSPQVIVIKANDLIENHLAKIGEMIK